MSAPPAVEGWFTRGDEGLRLVGSRCATCGTPAFPPGRVACPNPACPGTELETVELSATGRLWSWTVNHYAPPAPFVPPDRFEPYGIAAVELTEERLIVLGPVASGVDLATLSIGARMELAEGVVLAEDGTERAVWAWRPES